MLRRIVFFRSAGCHRLTVDIQLLQLTTIAAQQALLIPAVNVSINEGIPLASGTGLESPGNHPYDPLHP